jgi:hypothetical protein
VIVMDGSIRGRIPCCCTGGAADSKSGSEASPSEFERCDSLICVESCDLAEDGGNLNSLAALKGDGRNGDVDKWGEASLDPWLPRLRALPPDSSEGLSIVAFLWRSGIVRSPMKDVISYCVPLELEL